MIGGGMLQTMPKLGGVFAFVAIASLGLPGLAGFWGEVMALLSSFNPNEFVLADQVGLFRVFMVISSSRRKEIAPHREPMVPLDMVDAPSCSARRGPAWRRFPRGTGWRRAATCPSRRPRR